MEKRIQLGRAIPQAAGVCDLAGKFTGETKTSRSHLDPAAGSIFRRSRIKRRIYFHGGEVLRVEFEPLGVWQIRRIKGSPPVVKTPRACADAYLLLIGQIQMQ